MTEPFQIFKCQLCGNIVEVLHGQGAPLVCCGENMTLQEAKTQDAAKEKHVPFIEKIEKIEKVEGGYKVRIGQSAAHPMTEEHYIEWIELKVGDLVAKTYLKPGDAPEASFFVGECCGGECGQPTAREYCNVHGLWKG